MVTPEEWKVTSEKIDAVVERIVAEFNPTMIVQFGSTVRGDAKRDSDLDLLVVMKGVVKSRRRTSAEIRGRLRGIIMPMDILVISQSDLAAVGETPGLIYREALRTGNVLYEAA
jgi:predicted nucleotidyltransferase